MGTWVWTVLVFSIVCGNVNSQGSADLFVPCSGSQSNTGTSNQPALPQLPNQFSVHIEANIVQKNHTENFQEYYDYNGNRAAILKHNWKTGKMSRSIIDLNKQTASYVMPNGTCISLDASHKGYFGYMLNSNGSHLKTVKDFLYFSEDNQEVFVGADKIRGIPVNHWTACAESPKYNTTFTVDYYFTKDSYLIDQQNTSVPVRLVVNGTGRSVMRNGTVSVDFHDFYHIYEFSDFKWGPVEDESVFQVPVGVVCTNLSSTAGSHSPSIPNQFSAMIERTTQVEGQDPRRVGTELYVDMDSNIYRMDMTQPLEDRDRRVYGNNPLTMIFDYSVGMIFVIDKYERNCSVQRIPDNSDNRGPLSTPKHHPPSILAYFYQTNNFTYQGKKTLRDLEVDSWGYHNTTTGEVLELLFKDSTYTHRGNNLGIRTEPVGVYHYQPAKTSPRMPAVTSHEHVFNFMYGHPVEDAFDVVDCFSEGHHYTLFYVEITSSPPGQSLERLQYHHGAVWLAFRQVISSKAQVSITRIFDIHMEPKDDEVKQVYAEFRLLDNKLEGDDTSVYPGPTLEKARHNLMMAVQDNIKFTVTLSSTENMKLQISRGTLWEGYESNDDYQPQSSTIKKYSSASMAGLGIGMLVIGAILGLLAAFIIYKRIDTSVPYAVQD